MPDVDGIELLRFLRGNEAFAAVPVVSECRNFMCLQCASYLILSFKCARALACEYYSCACSIAFLRFFKQQNCDLSVG